MSQTFAVASHEPDTKELGSFGLMDKLMASPSWDSNVVMLSPECVDGVSGLEW
jgi:hypothetical protein